MSAVLGIRLNRAIHHFGLPILHMNRGKMTMKATILAVVVLLSCSGCATQYVASHPTKTDQEYYRDTAKCEAMANSAGTDNSYGTRQAVERLYVNCMRGEGWDMEAKR